MSRSQKRWRGGELILNSGFGCAIPFWRRRPYSGLDVCRYLLSLDHTFVSPHALAYATQSPVAEAAELYD
jgi:hypothetical protein